jgi:hypothetical protein
MEAEQKSAKCGKVIKQENAKDSKDDEGAATQQQHRQHHLPSLSISRNIAE